MQVLVTNNPLSLTGEFTPEMSQKIQQEQEKLFNQDPWKVRTK